MAAAAGQATGIFHIAEPRAYAWSEVLDHLARAVGRQGVRVRVPAPMLQVGAALTELVSRARGKPAIFDRDKALEVLAPGWVCETEGARRALGFEAKVPLEEGLRETAAWYRANDWLEPVRE